MVIVSYDKLVRCTLLLFTVAVTCLAWLSSLICQTLDICISFAHFAWLSHHSKVSAPKTSGLFTYHLTHHTILIPPIVSTSLIVLFVLSWGVSFSENSTPNPSWTFGVCLTPVKSK